MKLDGQTTEAFILAAILRIAGWIMIVAGIASGILGIAFNEENPLSGAIYGGSFLFSAVLLRSLALVINLLMEIKAKNMP